MASIEYLAGFFDGEGSIGVYSSGERRTGYMSVRVIQKFPTALRHFQELFGGSLNQNGRGYWAWQIYGTAAMGAMVALQPFLIEKKRQAELAIEYQLMMNSLPHRTAKVSPEDVDRRNEIALALKSMKRTDAYA